MARKNDKTAETALLLGSIAIFCVFLINSFIVFKHFSKKYNLTEADERVTDSLNIMTFIPKILLILGIPLLFYIFGAMIGDKLNNKNVFYIHCYRMYFRYYLGNTPLSKSWHDSNWGINI